MRNGILLGSLAFAITLAILVGNRLSNEAMAVVVGALCGISASIPVSLALFIAVSRNWGRNDIERDALIPRTHAPSYPSAQPQVIVVAPPQMTNQSYGFYPSPYYLPAPGADAASNAREFKIIGEE
ncbi:MAG: hypothetical protein HY868_23275 [Chloroflexi bacterium]|nr:hypothetical protein [Chloroflexota bacterium]